ncbi:MAG TPA: aminotransferase class V-fold PLP-dependent enzyme [Thermodesulfobacteriota bacterium]|nr:aminotransferase class V-fold PLP-dependent enzyme [Thermodesulfobacteriota bacterium]
MSHQSSLEKPLESYRDEFPVTKKYVYLDHAGVAPVSIRVKRAVDDFLKGVAEAGAFNYGFWMERVNQIRERCGELVDADAKEIAFVKNTSHGLSIVAEGLDWREGDNLIICEGEFPSNIYPWLNLGRKGVGIREAPSRGGRILIQGIERLIDSNTRLLTISSVQYVNGFRVDLKRVGELCKEKGVLLCVDAIQSLGVIPMNVKEFYVDFLSADGHKWLLAPEGIGMFYCRKELAEKINPPLIGWKSIQNESDYDHVDFRLKTNALRFEEGSLNVMGIFALGAAVELLLEAGISRIESRVLELGDLIIEEAEKRGFNIRTPGNKGERGGIVSVLGDFDPIMVKDKLKAQGIMVNVRGGAVRISPHFYNTEDEILRFFEAVDKIIENK